MPLHWSLRDVTELDLLLQRDTRLPDSVLDGIRKPGQSSSDLLRGWLQQCRNQDPEAGRIAEVTVRSEGLLRIALCLLGAVMGMVLVSGLLHYEGSRLINIGFFLGIVVGGQLLLLVAMGLGHVISRKPVALLDRWLLPKPIQRLSSSVSAPMWGWRLFTTLQLSALFTNLGILLGLFWHVLTRDLAFGWATTLQTGADSIHQLVSALARPWGGGYTPTLEQIENSRIRMSQGISELPPDATASWWPFLLLCILFYGMLPRLLLALAGQWRFNTQLRAPRFTSPSSHRLIQRLRRTPLTFEPAKDDGQTTSPHPSSALPAFTPSGPLYLQGTEDVISDALVDRLKETLSRTLSLAFHPQRTEASGILMVMEAWMPPLEETRQSIRLLREELGSTADLLILLVGEPGSPGQLPAAPQEEDVGIWRLKLAELEDAHLGVLVWPGDAA